MKKTYIIPQAHLVVQSFNPLMYTVSIYEDGPGDDKPVESKQSFFDDFEDDEDDGDYGFYTPYKI